VGDIGFHLWVAIGHGRKLAQVFRAGAKALPPFETIALAAQTLEDLLRALPVLPEVRLGGFGL
jgi:hypothetical protein